MAKIRFNSLVRDVSGAFENVVFRASNGRTVMARKADTNNNEPSTVQLAQRDRFRDAVAYGKAALANPGVRALYEAEAAERKTPVFSLTVADFFNAPTIRQVNLSGYSGQAGQLIKVTASDDFGVVNTRITIIDDAEGTTIESGFAGETAPGSGEWVYTTTVAVPAGSTVNINAVVSDRPGGTALETLTKTL